MSKRELRSAGSTTAQSLDKTKNYKLNSSGTLVESTGTPSGTEIVFTGSKSSLRRIADLERNVSILAAKALTEDGEGSGYSGAVDYSKTAGKWVQARTLSLTGDVTGSASIDGSGNVSLSTTVASNTVALGTDTTGNYMVNVTAGTGISVSHTQGEGSTATITNTDLGSSQNIFKNIAVSGQSTVVADSNNDTLTLVAGTNVTITTDATTDTITISANDSSVDWSEIQNKPDPVVTVTLTGDVTGSGSATLTDLASGTVSFATTIAANSVALGTDTTGNYMVNVTGGTGVSVSHTQGEGSTATISIGQAVGTSDSVQFNSLGVGTAAGPTTGSIRATNEITAYYSDKRLKENIKPIENALAKTLQLHGVTYNANDVAASFGYTNKEAQVGLLAQDVKAVLPEVVVPAPFDLVVRDGKEVSKSGQDFMTVKYEKIVALLVEAIKELNDKVESLEAQLGGSKSL